MLTVFASSRSAVFSVGHPPYVNNVFCSRQVLAVLARTADQISDDMKTTSMFVLLLALLSSFQLITAGESKNASQPHIVFILADDLVSS